MSNAKIISIMDHEVARSRAAIDETLTRLQLHLSVELADIQGNLTRLMTRYTLLLGEVAKLREDVDKLKQGGGSTELSV